MGSDSPGKQELDPKILGRAAKIIVDDRQQCLDHGEFGAAVRAGIVMGDAALPLGEALAQSGSILTHPNEIHVTNLTGLGAQDLAIAAQVYEACSAFPSRITTFLRDNSVDSQSQNASTQGGAAP